MMRELELGGLQWAIGGGHDRWGGGAGEPAVVLLHGYGAPGDELVQLYRAMLAPRRVRFAFPIGPFAFTPGFGTLRAWWPDAEDRRALVDGELGWLRGDVVEPIARARQQLAAGLRALEAKLEIPPDKLVLGGFCQGAMLALDLALFDDRPLNGLILMSAAMIGGSTWRQRMPARRALPVMQSHGVRDTLLSMDQAFVLRDALTEAGLALRWCGFDGEHEVPASLLEPLAIFIDDITKR